MDTEKKTRKKLPRKAVKKLTRKVKKTALQPFTITPELTYLIGPTIEQSNAEVEEFYATLGNDHPNALSIPQTLFSMEFMANGWKLGPAARKAYGEDYTLKWTAEYATTVGRSFTQIPKVNKYLQDKINERCKRLNVDADWIARKYKFWSEIDVTNYLEIVTSDKGKPCVQLKHNLEDLPELVRCAIKSISVSAAGSVKVEFIDQKASLDALAKLLGFMNDKISIDADQSISLHFDKQDEQA